MSLQRITELVERFRDRVAALSHAPGDARADAALPPELAKQLLESMLLARHLDVAAHVLRQEGAGHYTICSAGHEANVVLGRLTTPDDPTLVHYRSAAFVLERARARPEIDMVQDVLLALTAAESDPLCSGRHKAFGSKPLGILPQTSTIASHLPRALGLAFALERRRRLGLQTPVHAIALASFGDASLNHSTALGALNAASWTAYQNLPVPLLFVCEDNGLGISVRTPPGWVEARLRTWPELKYYWASGGDLFETFRVASLAIAHCRERRRPAVLHLGCQRLLGHAGSDVDTSYRSAAEIEQALQNDPVLAAAQALIHSGAATSAEVLALDQAAEARVERGMEAARRASKLSSFERIAKPLKLPDAPAFSGADAPASHTDALTLAQGLNLGLREILERDPGSVVLGEDVAKKGGVYGITKGLFKAFGPNRVFNTLLDEQTILGLSLGIANLGLLPIPEIQYLAYLHNAIDQLRGEALTLPFFSNAAYDNPMLIRIAGFAYQKGFGGHFHNENAIGALLELPGLIAVAPARGDDALELLRSAAQLARSYRRVVAVLEPIALYHTRDLAEPGDQGWLSSWSGAPANWVEPRVYQREASDLVIVSYANGLHLSQRAALRLRRDHGVSAKVLDLRWLCPLPVEAVARETRGINRLLIVDECREHAGIAEQLQVALLKRIPDLSCIVLNSANCFIPLGEAAQLVLIQEQDIVAAALELR